MRMNFAAIADYAAVTGDGKLVIAGIFDRITVAELPAVHPSMALAFRIEGEFGSRTRHQVSIRIVNPRGEDVIEPVTAEMNMISTDAEVPPGAQFVLSLPGVRFEQHGTHNVEIGVDGKHLETIVLRVVRPAPPQHAM